jgi:hypothetical protein
MASNTGRPSGGPFVLRGGPFLRPPLVGEHSFCRVCRVSPDRALVAAPNAPIAACALLFVCSTFSSELLIVEIGGELLVVTVGLIQTSQPLTGAAQDDLDRIIRII